MRQGRTIPINPGRGLKWRSSALTPDYLAIEAERGDYLPTTVCPEIGGKDCRRCVGLSRWFAVSSSSQIAAMIMASIGSRSS